MSYQDDRINGLQAQLNHLNNIKRALREREKNLNARMMYLDRPESFPANNIKSLRNSLLGNLPNHMIPGNVGGINEVTWPFLFQINLDLGDDPTIIDSTYTRGSFQVDQEAAFLLMSISRAHNTNAAGQTATINAPLQVEIIDRQSSRRFNNAPMPLQMIGQNSSPSILPTPMYVQPNAFIDFVVNGIPSTPQTFNGSGSFQLSFYGYRIRPDDAGKVLSTIFAP
ncbi:MAG: hypothetical protein HC883_00170 [Bdellovibrionaceae bacterium]|nr:hypothetical protein [Pseudobdellovibrionaceae bacterium]